MGQTVFATGKTHAVSDDVVFTVITDMTGPLMITTLESSSSVGLDPSVSVVNISRPS